MIEYAMNRGNGVRPLHHAIPGDVAKGVALTLKKTPDAELVIYQQQP